jgi:hypothetical protein
MIAIKNTMQPARSIVELLGGPRPLSRKFAAQEVNVSSGGISRWMMPLEKGGRGGAIPTKYWDALLSIGTTERKKTRILRLLKSHSHVVALK